MAKLNGPLGSKLRGKVGEVVAAKTVGGNTVIRAYQPVVKNPRTARQQNSRLRLSAASKLAADLDNAIQIGFAKACAGAAMYPRNMFVADVVPSGATSPITITDGVAVIDYTKVKVARKAGLSAVPYSIPALGSNDNIELTQYVPAEASQITGGKYGLVLVLFNPTKHEIAIGQTTTVVEEAFELSVPIPGGWAGVDLQAWGFYKLVPDSENDIATTTLPWKFPSETGASAYLGTVTLG